MKKAWTGAIAAAACTLAIGLSAQTTTPTPQTTRPSSTTAADQITVTGCLQRASSATAGATGTSGTTTAGTTSSMAGFVLNVSPSSSASTGSTASSTTAGTSGASATSYRLDSDESKLSPHVGHKVEITGSVDKSAGSSTTAPAGSTSTAGTSPSSSAGASMSPKLKVDSVRMIAASCTN